MQNNAFKIYNASAGSGKTFVLAKSYIKLLIESQNLNQFKSILAITFTNKAVGEMKERIINMLKLFSSTEGLAEPHPMFEAICEELQITPNYLHNKSKQVLKHIIHNYGGFDISTIDGFTHRVIRTFANDLKLPVNFEVELDQERLLTEAVDSVISKAGTDQDLTKVLIDFAIEKADDDKSWDISYDFNKIAKLLVNENDINQIEKLKGKSLDDFKQLKLQLAEKIKTLENEIIKIAKDTLALIEECGLQYDDFNRKSLPNHFENLSVKKFSINLDAAWQSDLIEGNTLYPKRVTDTIASTIESVQPILADAFNTTKKLIFKLRLYKAFIKNITPLSVLNAIQNELNLIKTEQNKLLISEFNKIISNEIKDQPTPFIYERLGEKFKHFFIDEFQDTSTMQWQNLMPLLDNSLSSANGTVMLVGDAKQAIYRWRGGEAEQFIQLYNKATDPFQTKAGVFSLATNYRSAKAIVNFNNSFFDYLGTTRFGNPDFGELYVKANQNTNLQLQGYVNLNFIDIKKEDDSNNLYAEKSLKTIKNCLENGYSLNEICVITRKRKEGVTIANFLSDNGINISSSETLLLKNSDKIIFLNSFLKLLVQPTNYSIKIEVLSFLATQHQITDKHRFYSRLIKKDLDETFEDLNSLGIYINKQSLLQLPLYELIEELIRTFKLNTTSDAFLQFYLDFVLEFTQKQNSDMAAFITYFESKQDSLSVVSPDNLNAVKITTIHKSKGLEFPIVIFPFAELNIYQELEPKVWIGVNETHYNNFETLLVNYNKDLENYNDAAKQIYDTHKSQLELDNINLLYVVLTRAVERLYIISKKDINSKGIVAENTYSGMLISYLQSIGKWADEKLTYSFGALENKPTKDGNKIPNEPLTLISVPKEDHNLNIITKSGMLWDTQQEKAIERGNLIHLILSKIETTEDVNYAFETLILNGDIRKENEDELKGAVMSVINNPNINQYFKSDYKIYNECDILTSSGQILRPDRLNINSKNEITIIDYKTGGQKPYHKTQLKDYELVLNTMDYTVAKSILVYINDSIDIIEV